MRVCKIARKESAQALIESIMGLFVIVPILLLMFDIGALILGVSVNEQQASKAARAAAGAIDPGSGSGTEARAREAAYRVVARLAESSIYHAPIPGDRQSFLQSLSYNGNVPNPDNIVGSQRSRRGYVVAYTSADIVLPICFPGMSSSTRMTSKCEAPIVALEPDAPRVLPIEAIEAVEAPIGP